MCDKHKVGEASSIAGKNIVSQLNVVPSTLPPIEENTPKRDAGVICVHTHAHLFQLPEAIYGRMTTTRRCGSEAHRLPCPTARGSIPSLPHITPGTATRRAPIGKPPGRDTATGCGPGRVRVSDSETRAAASNGRWPSWVQKGIPLHTACCLGSMASERCEPSDATLRLSGMCLRQVLWPASACRGWLAVAC